MRHHPNQSVLCLACQPRVHPRGQTSPDLSPAALSPHHLRPQLLSTVQAFGSLTWRLRLSLPPPFSLGVPTNLACAGPPMPPADVCEAGRGDAAARSPMPGHPADLPRSAVLPSIPRRRIDHVCPMVDGGLCGCVPTRPERTILRLRFRVSRPAPSFHASFGPHLTVTSWRCPGPSAPHTPGEGTFTPKHDCMHGTYARLQRLGAFCRIRCKSW